jgi:hypothetical protein
MKCPTVKEPWASLIASGAKRVENRSWRTRHRGPLAIHAAKTRTQPGEIIAVVELIDCVAIDEVAGEPYAEGPWCWILRDGRRVKPVPYRGRQKLFDVPESAVV